MGTISPKLVDVVLPPSGYPTEIAVGDTREEMMGSVQEAGGIITDFPKEMWIERKDWTEVARYLKETKTRAMDFVDRFTNQDPTHECTCHSLSKGFECARNRARRISLGGPVKGVRHDISAKSGSVWVSPLSIYAEANPRQYGGAGVRQVLKIATRRGFLPDNIQPRDYGFKHTMQGTTGEGNLNQSSGKWVPLSRFPEGYEQTSMHFRPLEYIFPETWEQSVCLVLNSLIVCVGRDGHAVPHAEWIPEDDVMAYPDSYDIVRYDSISRIKATVGGSFAIVSTSLPDSWDKPAG